MDAGHSHELTSEAPQVALRVLPSVLGGFAGLLGLVVAIVAGLIADNESLTLIWRGLLAMVGCWMLGYGSGWALERAVRADAVSGSAEDSGHHGDSDDSLQSGESTVESPERRDVA